uniref:Uncharacterized protein n=1 Tax=Ciona intestinalis TaxID=7719 RepID=F6YSU1_CIOIN
MNHKVLFLVLLLVAVQQVECSLRKIDWTKWNVKQAEQESSDDAPEILKKTFDSYYLQ